LQGLSGITAQNFNLDQNNMGSGTPKIAADVVDPNNEVQAVLLTVVSIINGQVVEEWTTSLPYAYSTNQSPLSNLPWVIGQQFVVTARPVRKADGLVWKPFTVTFTVTGIK
jgi:hypothetical protein